MRRRQTGGALRDSTPAVAAVVPAIDEQTAIRDVVRGLRASGACCVYVVDGGSRDETRRVVLEAGGLVLDEPRRGYGRACLTGAERALDPAASGHAHDVVAFLDGDGSCDPGDLPVLLSALSTADVAFGRRPGRLIEQGAMPWHARLGNDLVAAIMSIRAGRTVHDLPPFKALRAPALARLDLSDPGYAWTTQLVARVIAEPTIRFREIPVRFRRRQGGTSKVSGSWRASVAAGRAMVGHAWSETAARPLLGLMAKAPGPGRAKTRLAAKLGDEAAAAFWTACLSDAAAGSLDASRAAHLTPVAMLPSDADVDAVVRIIGPAWTPIVQTRPGLATALADVFLAAFDRGADRAIAVAGDAPGLPPARIEAAMGVLAGGPRRAVLGPSDDGGYHLVGARWRQVPRSTPAPIRRRLRRNLADRLRRAFAEPATGSSTAFDAARSGLESAGWQVATVESWPDVDTMADLHRLAVLLDADGRWAPRTVEWLRHSLTSIEGA
jgi:glycosyltransferase A (GT-A) superfamily protein (DUF2064 family)